MADMQLPTTHNKILPHMTITEMLAHRTKTIRETSTPVLEKIAAYLLVLEPDHERRGGFGSFALDDLYADVDFELASRWFLRDQVSTWVKEMRNT